MVYIYIYIYIYMYIYIYVYIYIYDEYMMNKWDLNDLKLIIIKETEKEY